METLKIIIAILAPVFTGVVGVYKDELRNYFFGGRKYKYLKGVWRCEWKEDPNAKYPNGNTTVDSSTITKVFGKIARGKGVTQILGEWKLNGEISESAVTFTYQLKKDKLKHNLGIIILEVDDANHNVLNGRWMQYNGNEIVGGTTKWEKVAEN